jgi:thiol:disulfide interchange protein
MSYHDLSECTLNDVERREEATRIVIMLVDVTGKSQHEHDFIRKMSRPGPVSVKQLFWLRDIKDKYL